MILTALFPENRIRYLSRNIAIPYRCAFTRLPRNSGFDLRVAETLFYPTLFSNVSPLVHASRTTREVADKPGRRRERGGRRQRIVKRLKLLWSGEGKGGFFCPEDLLVIKPNGRRNSPAISHRFGRRLKERGVAVWSRSRPPRDRSEAVHRHFRPSWTSLAVHRTLRFHPSLSHLLPFFLLPPPFPEISPARFLAFEEIKV